MSRTEDVGGWGHVDRARDPAAVICLLDGIRQGVQGLRDHVLRRMDVRAGDAVLDVGCGTGDTTREAIARGGAERAVGIDASTTMIEEARRRAASESSAAEFLVADAEALPIPRGTFDACRVERTLQHLTRPGTAVSEMARVLRPGGRLVAFEPDWHAMIVDHPDRELTARIVAVVAGGIRQPWIGRSLLSLFAASGLTDLHAESAGTRSGFVWFRTSRRLRRAAETGELDGADLDRWLADGERADGEGRFLAINPVFVVSGRKPG